MRLLTASQHALACHPRLNLDTTSIFNVLALRRSFGIERRSRAPLNLKSEIPVLVYLEIDYSQNFPLRSGTIVAIDRGRTLSWNAGDE